MLPSKQLLTTLIGGVYDAAAEPALWPVFLGQLARSSQADAAALVMHCSENEHTVSASWNLDPDGIRRYQQHYGSIDAWSKQAKPKSTGHVCTSDSLCPLSELVATEFYNDFLLRYGIVHGMFGLVEQDDAQWASVSLYRGSSSGEFRVSDLEILDLLVPHVQRAFKLHFQFSQLAGRAEGAESALDKLATGVVFLGATGEVLLMNRVAEELLSAKDGLFLARGRLSPGVRTESVRLQTLCSDAAKTGSGKSLSAGGTISISRERGRPLSITVAPLRGFDNHIAQRPAAVLFISDPERIVELPAGMLQRCYGLTPAEARLAMVLSEGHSLTAAADSCGVTHNTAKSQLKSVFSKTQVKRQGELIRLLLNTAGILRPRSEQT